MGYSVLGSAREIQRVFESLEMLGPGDDTPCGSTLCAETVRALYLVGLVSLPRCPKLAALCKGLWANQPFDFSESPSHSQSLSLCWGSKSLWHWVSWLHLEGDSSQVSRGRSPAFVSIFIAVWLNAALKGELSNSNFIFVKSALSFFLIVSPTQP